MSNRRFILYDDENIYCDARKRRRILRIDEEDDDEEGDCNRSEKLSSGETASDKEDEFELRPFGKPVEVFGEGDEKTSYFASFFYNGVQYDLEDTVLLDPEREEEKPYVAIIKEIFETHLEPLKITVQWLYRPEEAVKRGGTYQPRCARELFLSFHHDEVHAESVKHKCVVHYIPPTKQIPDPKQHPGFVVQCVYDFEEFKIYSIGDTNYKDDEQHEVNRCLRKTIEELGDLPDFVEPKPVKKERLDKKRSVSPVDCSPVDNGLHKFESLERTSTIGSEYFSVMSSFKLLTKIRTRDTWLEKLLESVQLTCATMSHNQNGREKGNEVSKWPIEAVSAVAALENAAHSALSSNPGKYKQKMRQLVFNLKNNDLLARRLLIKELEPAQILKMSPEELKTGSIAEEIPSREPEYKRYMLMTEATCTSCSQKRVAIKSLFQAGCGNRYLVECQACGIESWYNMLPH